MKKKGQVPGILGVLVVAASLAAPGAAFADPGGSRFGIQIGGGASLDHDVQKAELGIAWDPDLNWWEIGGWHFKLVGEGEAAWWHTHGDVHRDIGEFGITPMIRFIKDAGAIRPYFEAGAGLRLLTHPTVAQDYTLSSAFQFTEVVGIGMQFGSRQQYLAGFRFQHISNASIKEPNPGINFTKLYLQYNF